MMTWRTLPAVALLIFALVCVTAPGFAEPFGTAFTYQGELTRAGAPLNGTAKLTFKLWDSATGGTQLGTQVINSVPVAQGIFTVQLNRNQELGAGSFQGQRRWMEIAVNDSLLTPRQELTPAPYALYSSAPWVTNGTTITYTAGNVGIGTASPNPVFALDVAGTGNQSAAIHGGSATGSGVYGSSGGSFVAGLSGENTAGGYGVIGSNTPAGNTGMLGTSSEGVLGNSGTGNGVTGTTTGGTGVSGSGYNGLYGFSGISNGNGLKAECHTGSNAYGVWGYSTTGWAGTFSGNTQVTGNFYAGAKFFRIDDPIDPDNKILTHACVESSEMKNIYDGTAVLDGMGEAWVELPAWFESLNESFRYQLTCIGQAAPLFIKQEITGNRFLIGGGAPGMKVSWQVTGVRHDPFAKAHPWQVETEKEGASRGQYLHPEVYGLPESRNVEYDKLTASRKPEPAVKR